jgi:hypothetical protein
MWTAEKNAVKKIYTICVVYNMLMNGKTVLGTRGEILENGETICEKIICGGTATE